jgi:hypothetical protein
MSGDYCYLIAFARIVRISSALSLALSRSLSNVLARNALVLFAFEDSCLFAQALLDFAQSIQRTVPFFSPHSSSDLVSRYQRHRKSNLDQRRQRRGSQAVHQGSKECRERQRLWTLTGDQLMVSIIPWWNPLDFRDSQMPERVSR